MYPSCILRFLLEEYLTITIAMLIKLYALDWSNWFESISSIFAIFLGFAVIVSPFMLWSFLYANHKKMRNAVFLRRYSSLVDGLTHRRISAILYGVIFIFRRMALALFIIVIPALNWLQTQLVVLTCSLVIISIGWIQPFQLPVSNSMEIFNEVLVLISFYFMIIYSEFVPDVEARYNVAWVNICLIVGMVAYNIGFSMRSQAKEYK